MFNHFVSQTHPRALATVRQAVWVVGLLLWGTGWGVAAQMPELRSLNAMLCWSAAPVTWAALAIGYGLSWRWAAWALALGWFAIMALLGWWQVLPSAAVLLNMLGLVAYAGWALGLRAAVTCAEAAAVLAVVLQTRGFTSLEDTLPLAHILLLLLWLLWQVHKHASQQLQALERNAQLAKAQSEQLTLLLHALDHTPESVAIVDFQSRVVYANKTFERMSGYTREDVIGRNAVPVSLSALGEDEYLKMRRIVEQGQVWSSVLHNHRKDGQPVMESVSIAPVEDEAGRITHFIQIKQDLRERLDNEQRIDRLQHLDAVTQLPNLPALLRRLDHVMLEQSLCGADPDLPAGARWGGLLMLEMGRFSEFQDACGIAAAEAMRQAMARKLQQLLPSHVWLANSQPDRFAVLYDNAGQNQAQALRALHSLALGLREGVYHLLPPQGPDAEGAAPSDDAGAQALALWKMHCSIGLTVFSVEEPRVQAEGAEYVLRCARVALRQARSRGTDQIQAYSEDLGEATQRKMLLESGLNLALQLREPQQLQLYVQPQVDWRGRVHSVEALLRWQHPQQGWVSPGEFIPVAESTGLIVALGDWVLEQVCALLQAPRVVAGGYGVSANISALQLLQPDFVSKVQGHLQRSGIRPDKLTLEVTESALLDDVQAAIATMQALKALGVQLALDDFGTGYSSLSYLKELPIHEIKMDQSFLRDLQPQGVSGALVEAVLMVAQRKGLRVVAEGVEQAEQAELLHAWDPSVLCQGYFFSRPMPIAQWLANPDLIAEDGKPLCS